MAAHGGNANVLKHVELASPNVSTNPFLTDVRETVRTDMGLVGSAGDRHVGGEESSNPFLVSMELTTGATELAAGGATARPWTPHFNIAWPPTPPSTVLKNPFLTPAKQERAADRESMFTPQCIYDVPINMASTPAAALRYGMNNNFNQTFDCQPTNPFSPGSNDYTRFTPAPASFPQPTVSPSTPPMPQYVGHQAQDYYSVPHCNAQLPGGRRAKMATRFPSRTVRGGDSMDSSDEEQYEQRERIPTLQPGHFDGSGSWKDFLYQFESCAQANHWSERTMAVQLRFSLTGAAGAIVHKNPRSARWSYQKIVDEVDAAYGPGSVHAAAIGIELRQRVRGPSEALHSLRDDIYEKVSIVYADRTEREQDAISVEIFTNALADAEVIQRLLEEQPRTLARAYEIAHRYETTRRAARAVTQLMQPGRRSTAEWRARAATVRENTSVMVCDEPVGVAARSTNPPDRKPRSHQQWQPKRSRYVEMNSAGVVCHNCSGVGHLQRNCPSRQPKPRTPGISLTPAPDSGAVVTCIKSQEGEMSVKILIHGLEMCALLDSGARRNVLPLHHFESIPIEFRPPIQPSVAQVLQGIGPEGLKVIGEVTLPVYAGSGVTNVNFIMADTAESTEVILGHPFLQQARAHLDYGGREITLFGEKVPRFNPNHQPEVHIVRVARTTVLEPGCEYVVPGTARLRYAADGDMMLSPTKGFVEKHHVLVQGWPTSQRLRATFFTMLLQRATSYTLAQMRNPLSPSLFCSQPFSVLPHSLPPLSLSHTDKMKI